ncbi:fungal-specific transcription factor domain-containing protein [Aspergillus varians]
MSQVEPARKRVSIACTPCRKKRVKCDGQKPGCGRCADELDSCEYRHGEEKRKPPSKQQVQALHARIEDLEAQLREYRTQFGPLAGHSFSPERPRDSAAVQSPSEALKSPNPTDDIADLLGGLSLGEGNQLRYFGSRSHLSLIEQQLDTKGHASLNTSISENNRQNPPLHIPLRPETQEELLQSFWKWQNAWQYLVHKQVFLTSLANGGQDGYCTQLLLLSIMALAARYFDIRETRSNSDNPRTAGDGLARQAKELLMEEMEAPRISTVIAAALISLKEMAANKEPAGWTYIGIAVRMAYNLGLHVNPSRWVASGAMTTEEAELRSIAWWGCYMIEKYAPLLRLFYRMMLIRRIGSLRLFTVGIGRPSIILERDIQVPLPSILPEIEYGLWDESAQPSTDIIPLISYSITTSHYMSRMLQMVVKPLDDIYTPDNYIPPSEKKSIMTRATVELTSFYNNFPSILRLPSSSSKQPVAPHIYCLHIHYHTMIILLHRPFLTVQNVFNPLDSLLNKTSFSYVETCSKSAEQVTYLFRAYAKFFSLRTISISVVDSARTAGLIHLFNMASPDQLMQEKSRRLFLETLRYLQDMSFSWGWAQRSIRALVSICQKWAMHERVKGLFPTSVWRDNNDGDNDKPEADSPVAAESPLHLLPFQDVDLSGFMEWQDLNWIYDQDPISNPDMLYETYEHLLP